MPTEKYAGPIISIAKGLGNFHDRLTLAGFAAAAIFVAVIAASFCYEVVARYAFSAPTEWSYAVVSYALCAVIFLSMPEQTRRGAQVAINLLLDGLAPSNAVRLQNIVRVFAAIACLAAGWISAEETWRQYAQGISTISAFPIPKWWISIVIPYGTLSSAIHFLRQLASNSPTSDLLEDATL